MPYKCNQFFQKINGLFQGPEVGKPQIASIWQSLIWTVVCGRSFHFPQPFLSWSLQGLFGLDLTKWFTIEQICQCSATPVASQFFGSCSDCRDKWHHVTLEDMPSISGFSCLQQMILNAFKYISWQLLLFPFRKFHILLSPSLWTARTNGLRTYQIDQSLHFFTWCWYLHLQKYQMLPVGRKG